MQKDRHLKRLQFFFNVQITKHLAIAEFCNSVSCVIVPAVKAAAMLGFLGLQTLTKEVPVNEAVPG